MSLARSSAYSAAPIPLRLIIAVTFVWAGLGKFIATMPVQGEQAALLANMGVSLPAPAPDADAPDQDTVPEPADQPESEPAPTRDDGAPDTPTGDDPPPPGGSLPPLMQAAGAAPATTQAPGFTAGDFPEPVEVSRLHGLALLTYGAAHPGTADDGTPIKPIWPEWAARDHWPVTLAWTAAITELAAAVLILVGLLTRLSALSIAGVMLTAAWLTELGPAIQSGDTLLGFLPSRPLWDPGAWKTLLWQFSLAGAALALALAGPGAFSLDRAITGRGSGRDDYEDEDGED
jgi:uncharacterized membrane protein YphA (DoxX/SURF4 family)